MQIKRGAPVGTKRDGNFGRGVKTAVMRVPEGKQDLVVRLLVDLPLLVEQWESASKDTRDWTQAKRLLSELQSLLDG